MRALLLAAIAIPSIAVAGSTLRTTLRAPAQSAIKSWIAAKSPGTQPIATKGAPPVFVRASTAHYSLTGATATSTVAANEARIDDKGLIIEESATGYFPYGCLPASGARTINLSTGTYLTWVEAADTSSMVLAVDGATATGLPLTISATSTYGKTFTIDVAGTITATITGTTTYAAVDKWDNANISHKGSKICAGATSEARARESLAQATPASFSSWTQGCIKAYFNPWQGWARGGSEDKSYYLWGIPADSAGSSPREAAAVYMGDSPYGLQFLGYNASGTLMYEYRFQAPSSGTAHEIKFCRDTTTGNVAAFSDGVAMTSIYSVGSATFAYAGPSIYWGNSASAASNAFNGHIYDMQITRGGALPFTYLSGIVDAAAAPTTPVNHTTSDEQFCISTTALQATANGWGDASPSAYRLFRLYRSGSNPRVEIVNYGSSSTLYVETTDHAGNYYYSSAAQPTGTSPVKITLCINYTFGTARLFYNGVLQSLGGASGTITKPNVAYTTLATASTDGIANPFPGTSTSVYVVKGTLPPP